jgi:hypothetical protein
VANGSEFFCTNKAKSYKCYKEISDLTAREISANFSGFFSNCCRSSIASFNNAMSASYFSCNLWTLDSFSCCFSKVSLYAPYVKTILHLAQNLESGLLDSQQLGHCFGFSKFIFFSLCFTIPEISSSVVQVNLWHLAYRGPASMVA